MNKLNTNFGTVLAVVALLCLVLPSPVVQELASAQTQTQLRTVIDKEVGSLYESPTGSWSDYGAFVGSPSSLDAAAIRAMMAHFDKFTAWEEQYSWGMPYSKLRAYEAGQKAEGKSGIFVTATYQGKVRPVLFSWSLGLVNGKPTAPADQWAYPVNVKDPRFVHFWINHYVQPMLAKYQNQAPRLGPDLRFQMDQSAFIYSLFGVLDNSNTFVAGVPWDSPFPQNQAEYEAGIESFFSQVQQLAPNIRLMPNFGTQVTPSHFPQLFGTVSGGIFEDLYQFVSRPAYVREAWYNNTFQYFPWLASHSRAGLLRAVVSPSDRQALITTFSMYSLLKGADFFFAPGDSTGHTLAPSTWAGMKAQLGSPTGNMLSSAPSSKGAGHRLFWRNYETGIVYLNWYGTEQTIHLDTLHAYYDPSGKRVTELLIPDGVGTYVTTTPKAIAAPRIGPRYAGTVEGPVLVTMESDVAGAVIRYTLNGTVPTSSSPVYTGAVDLTHSATVQARAFYGSSSSPSSVASYTVSTSPLIAQLLRTSDSSLSGTYYPVVTLNEIPSPNRTIEVKYKVTNGTPAVGSYTFLPGQTYGILPVTTSTTGTTTVSITNVIGAELGANSTLHYYVVK